MKPKIILHMATTIDGKITGDFLLTEIGKELSEEYYRIHRDYNADAYLCGRVTFEGSFTFGKLPESEKFIGENISNNDYIAMRHTKYAIAIDTHGRLGWNDSIIRDDDPGYDNAHIIVAVTGTTPKEYLAYLRSMNISYIFCGNDTVNVNDLCERLYELFGIKTLMLEGGGLTDSAFLKEGLIDEISLVVVPVIDGGKDVDLFDNKSGGNLSYNKVETKPLPNGGLWLNYT